jgi:hypothetical protein
MLRKDSRHFSFAAPFSLLQKSQFGALEDLPARHIPVFF